MSHTPPPWRQGKTLITPITRRWTHEQITANDLIERRRVFASFLEQDQGRSRRLVADCATEEDAAYIVHCTDTHAQLVAALKASTEALTAWLHQYAPDCCESESVATYHDMIASRGGTLSYVARQLGQIRAALQAAEEAG